MVGIGCEVKEGASEVGFLFLLLAANIREVEEEVEEAEEGKMQ